MRALVARAEKAARDDGFAAGYDAGWGDTAEGHNGEYTSPRFTTEHYNTSRATALAAYLATKETT